MDAESTGSPSALANRLRVMDDSPFIGSEALASGRLNAYQLRRYHRAILPNVYVPENTEPSLQQRAIGAWLWSGRQGVVAGLAASALHGAKWVDDDSPVELIWRNARSPSGVITRHDLLLDGEAKVLDGLPVTTPARTAFDLGRRGGLMQAVAHLDALARATKVQASDVAGLAAEHPHTRGLRRLEKALDLMDPGAESPRETWLRLLLMRQGYPRPRTQIPVISPDGWRKYYLDMGWEDIKLAVEYEGDHHRTSKEAFAYEIQRAEDIHERGWHVVRAAARSREADLLARVERAWRLRTH